jgi:hypothetical protein
MVRWLVHYELEHTHMFLIELKALAELGLSVLFHLTKLHVYVLYSIIPIHFVVDKDQPVANLLQLKHLAHISNELLEF